MSESVVDVSAKTTESEIKTSTVDSSTPSPTTSTMESVKRGIEATTGTDVEQHGYLNKKQRIRLSKKTKNAQITAENKDTTAPHECPLCSTDKEQAPFYHYGHETERLYYKCGKCSLVFAPRSSYLSESEEAKRYAMHDNDILQDGYRSFLNTTVTPLTEILKSTQSQWDEFMNSKSDEEKVVLFDGGLDFGCGPGPSISILMGETGYKVINYDPQFYPNTDENVTATVTTDEKKSDNTPQTIPQTIPSSDILFSQPALQRQYRFITCTEVIEHVKEPMSVWTQLYKMLASGGILAVMTGVIQNDQMFNGWHYHRDPTHICFYHKATVDYVESLFSWKKSQPHKNVIFFTKSA